jgi:hypothetical protein
MLMSALMILKSTTDSTCDFAVTLSTGTAFRGSLIEKWYQHDRPETRRDYRPNY